MRFKLNSKFELFDQKINGSVSKETASAVLIKTGSAVTGFVWIPKSIIIKKGEGVYLLPAWFMSKHFD